MSDFTLALIADIHGNAWALDAVLDDIRRRGVRVVVNLGDSLNGPLDPSGTADLLLRHGVPSLRGNGDREVLEGLAPQVRAHLTPAHLAWLRDLPETLTVADLLLCHGTPTCDDQPLLETITAQGARPATPDEITARLDGTRARALACAHSHLARVVRLPDGRSIINPGSVGLPAYTDEAPHPHAMQSGSPHARYALLSRWGDEWTVEQLCVPYDWHAAAAQARRAGRPDWAAWLSTGWT